MEIEILKESADRDPKRKWKSESKKKLGIGFPKESGDRNPKTRRGASRKRTRKGVELLGRGIFIRIVFHFGRVREVRDGGRDGQRFALPGGRVGSASRCQLARRSDVVLVRPFC